jgi:hypothetical protein
VLEVPIHFADRAAGQSKMSVREQIESALIPIRLRFGPRGRQPIHGRTALAVGQCCEFAVPAVPAIPAIPKVPDVPQPRSRHRASHRKTAVKAGQ